MAMKLTNPTAEVFVPDGLGPEAALARTTAMGVVAHQDDMEILAYHGIVAAFGRPDAWFSGAVVTNGSGSARSGLYADYTDEQMCVVRRQEQKKAAVVGEYAAVALLDYISAAVKDPKATGTVSDLVTLITAARPKVIYTHNLADKHDTHVAVALRLIQALRLVPAAARPERLYGCEVWRDLDWLCDADKVPLRVDAHENLAAALLGVYDSQIAGGKRYDLATMGRRRANATFFASHGVDDSEGLTFAVDMTPLVQDPSLPPAAFVAAQLERFAAEVKGRVTRFSAC
jgi:LmbE family N-acetylglucosaminyl deacetylase